MRIPGRRQANSAGSDGTDAPITKANYVQRAQDFVKMHGGEGFVIRWKVTERRGSNVEGDFTPAQWRAWLAYYDRIGLPTTYLRQHGVGTAPAEWPEDFDPTVARSDKGWAPPIEEYEFPLAYQDIMRQRIGGLFRDLSRSLTGLPDPLRPHKKTDAETRAEAEAAIESGFAHLQAPLAVSDNLRQSNARHARMLAASGDEVP
jgi:hypothetical protein